MAASVFPGELYRPLKVWGERAYSKLYYWNEVAKGGHFAAFEQPEIFVAELRKAHVLTAVSKKGPRHASLTKVGLEALLTPDNCVVVMIDHQRFQLANVNSHEPTMVINNAIGLAMTARAYRIPTILTTVNEDSGAAR